MMKNKKVLISTYVCNTLEVYDFILGGVLIPYISHLFFPMDNKFLVLLAGSLTFLIGFVLRPIGGIFFGYIGDTFGRKKALLGSIFGMAIATLLTGLLPTYETISIFAPISLVILRMIQGFCLGGEGQGANVFVMEHSKGVRSGLIGGILATSNGTAALLAFGITSFSLSGALGEWGWRLPYIFGSLIAVVGLYMRRDTQETEIFSKSKKKEQVKFPLLSITKEHKLNLVYVFLCVGVGSSLTYTGFTFVNILLNQYLHFSSTQSLAFSALGTVFAMIMVLIGGYACDKMGPKKTVIFSLVLILLFIVPVHLFLASTSAKSIVTALLLLAIPTGGICGSMPHLIASSFPVMNRYSGAAFGNNLAQALLGGTQPIIALYLIKETNLLWAPALYTFLLALAFLFFIGYFKNRIISYTYTSKENLYGAS